MLLQLEEILRSFWVLGKLLIDIATAGESIPGIVRLTGASPFFFSSVIADRKFTTATIFYQAGIDERADLPVSRVRGQAVTDGLVGSRLCAFCVPVTATVVLQARVDFETHDAVACVARLAHAHPASWGGPFTVGLGRAAPIADLTGINGCTDCPVPLESCCTFTRGGAIWVEKAVGTGVAHPIAAVFCDGNVTFHSSPANITFTGAITRESLVASSMDTRTCLIAVDAIFALDAALTGRPTEALSTLTGARAIHAIQADPVTEADILTFPWAGLALGPKEASTARPGNDSFHTLWLASNEWGTLSHEIYGVDTSPRLATQRFSPKWADWLLRTLSTLASYNACVIIITPVLLNFQNFPQAMDHTLVSGYVGIVDWSLICIELVVAKKEAEEVGETQHGLPVHAMVQVILQEFLIQDHVIPHYVLL